MTKQQMVSMLSMMVKVAPKPTQGTRLVKIHCPECGMIARTTNKWIDALPVCSACSTYFEVA